MREGRNIRKRMHPASRWLIPVFLLISGSALAQPYNSVSGFFQVDQKKGCASFTVTIVSVPAGECTAIKPCTMNFGDGTPAAQNVFVHTYLNPGTFTLSIQPQSIAADNLVITVDQNIQPNFEIHACAANRAQIQVVDNNYDQYVIDFNNDGTPENILPGPSPTTPTHIYAAGTHTASVRGRDLNTADNCTAKTQPFTAIGILPVPSITTLTSVDVSNITLDFTTVPNVQYRMEIAVNSSGPFQIYQTLFGVNTLAVPNLNLDNNFYCFRLGAYNPCNGVSTYSNTICTNKLAVTAQNNVIVVTSTTAGGPGAITYSNARSDGVTATSSSNVFPDTDVECKTTYCYRVTTRYGNPVTGPKSISLEKCATAFSTDIPTPIDDVEATVGLNGATLTWKQDPLFVPVFHNVNRSEAGGAFTPYAHPSGSPYVDNIYTTTGKYCYEVNYSDKCDNPSVAGIVVCPVRLTGTLDLTNVISLHWSSYKGFKNGVKNYVLDKYNLAGAKFASITTTDTTYIEDIPDPDNQYLRYVVRVIPNSVASGVGISNELVFIKNANLYAPTAFSPNSDNLNDGFIVSGQFIVKIKLTIFDRWGSVLFSTTKNEPWDGAASGKPMPPSTYVWKADITDLAGRTFSEEGTVALFRN